MENHPLFLKIRKRMTEALSKYRMLDDGDKIMVAVSGGKDSSMMLLALDSIRKRAPYAFTLHPTILDQKQPGFSVERFQDWLHDRGFALEVIHEDTYSAVKAKTEPGKSFCGLCSRLRRGILYTHAAKHGFHKIALGHHRDDLNETLLLNIFHNGRIASMPPKLRSDDGRNTVIRPMALVPETQIAQLATELEIPVIPCNLCGSQENLQRAQIKSLLRNISKDRPSLGASMLMAQQNVRPTQLADTAIHGFLDL